MKDSCLRDMLSRGHTAAVCGGGGLLISWASSSRQLRHEAVCLKYIEISLCVIHLNALRRGRN